MSVERNTAIVSRIWEEMWNGGKLEAADVIFAPDYLGHIPSVPGGVHGPDAFKQLVATYRTAFPDVHLTVDDVVADVVADGDKVVVRWTSRGTHQGPFLGTAPTGRRIEVMGISIFRLADDKIQEEWEGFDTLGLMQQLGVVPSGGQGS